MMKTSPNAIASICGGGVRGAPSVDASVSLVFEARDVHGFPHGLVLGLSHCTFDACRKEGLYWVCSP